MKNYQVELTNYELTLLKYLVYERKALLKREYNEIPESFRSGFKKNYKLANKLLSKLVSVKSEITDFYNYDLLERKDKSYNELNKEHFNAK